MAIEFKMEIVDKITKQPVILQECACGNKTFYILSDKSYICAACQMTEAEAIAFQEENKPK